MQREQELDGRIKAALDQECAGISASAALKGRIDEAVCGQQTGQEQTHTVKHFGLKKFCVCAAAACLLVSGISVFAGRVDFFVSMGKMEPDYTDYRDMEKAQDKLGYAVDSVERFANGYEFAGAGVDSISAYSEENGEMYNVPMLDVRYRKDGMLLDLVVSETAESASFDVHFGEPEAERMCGDIRLRYDEYTNKMVPEGYERTEEDIINEQRDDFQILYLTVTEKENNAAGKQKASDGEKRDSYYIGANESAITVMLKETGENWMEWKEGGEPYTVQTKRVSWEKNGKRYELSGADLNLDADGLFAMAEELITAGSN